MERAVRNKRTNNDLVITQLQADDTVTQKHSKFIFERLPNVKEGIIYEKIISNSICDNISLALKLPTKIEVIDISDDEETLPQIENVSQPIEKTSNLKEKNNSNAILSTDREKASYKNETNSEEKLSALIARIGKKEKSTLLTTAQPLSQTRFVKQRFPLTTGRETVSKSKPQSEEQPQIPLQSSDNFVRRRRPRNRSSKRTSQRQKLCKEQDIQSYVVSVNRSYVKNQNASRRQL